MSYCRYENTLKDLRDCYDHMDEPIANEREERARDELVALCNLLASDYDDSYGDDE